MKTSDQLDKFGADFAQAQAEMGGAVKDSANPFFRSKYADLTSVWLACKEALHKYGFSVIQSPIEDRERIGVETLLLHKSGQWVSDRFTLGVKKQNDPQADGSSITYARRYALAAFVGVCPVDDDAEGSMVRGGADNQKPAKGHILPEKQTSAFYEEQLDAIQTPEDMTAWKESNAGDINNFLRGAELAKFKARYEEHFAYVTKINDVVGK